MSFSDTITLTVGGASKALGMISRLGMTATYRLQEATGEYVLKIRHTEIAAKGSRSARSRHNVDLTYKVYATPTTAEVVDQFYTVMDMPSGASNVNLANAVSAWLIATSNAALLKLLNFES